MTNLYELCERAFSAVLSASLHANGLILLVALAQWLARDRISARWQHVLWLLVAARLCLPHGLESPTSAWGLLVAGSPTASRAELVAFPAPAAADREATPSAPGSPSAAPAALSRSPWVLIWLGGCLLLAIRLVVRHAAALRGLGALAPATDLRLLATLADSARALRVRPPRAFISSSVRSPALLGCLRPRLLLPADGLADTSPADLRRVLLHELAHLKRRDVARHWLFAALECVHWFNPLVRWAFVCARQACEHACDEMAVRASGDADGRSYAALLLRLAAAAAEPRGPAVVLGLRGGSSLERRICWIADHGARRTSALLAALLFAGCAATGLTESAAEGGAGENVVRVYEVGAFVEPPRDFAAPELGVRPHEPGPSPASAATTAEAEQAQRHRMEALRDELLRRVPSPSWGSSSTLEIDGERLRAVAPVSLQAELLKVLNEKLAAAGRAIYLECRVLALDAAALADLPAPLGPALVAAATTGGSQPRTLDAGELAALEASRRADGTSVVLERPRVTQRAGQLVHIMVARQQPIVTGAQAGAGSGDPEPQLGLLNLGVTVQSRGVPRPQGGRLDLELQLDWADQAAPLESKRVDGKLVQVPHLARATARAKLDARDGEWFIACAARPDVALPGTEHLVLLAKAELIAP